MGQSKMSIGLRFLLLLKSRHITTETQSMEMPMIRRNRDVSRPNFNQSNPRCANRCASYLKTNLAHAFRVMAPALFALTFASVAHAQGTMDFSGAQTLMGTFKTFPLLHFPLYCLPHPPCEKSVSGLISSFPQLSF
jgi:hypothetical protein